MSNYIRIIIENTKSSKKLTESVLKEYKVKDSGVLIYEIPLRKDLSTKESNRFAEKMSNFLFDQGFTSFDIEFSSEKYDFDKKNINEETYHGDDFFKEYDILGYVEGDALWEAEYQGRKVTLNKPMRGDVKKFKVYVRDPKTKNVKKVNFGDPNMRIKKSDPKRRRSFRARHNCDNPGPKTSARYWSCKKW